MAKHDGFLGAVYDAKGSEAIAELYDKWAATYDAEMARIGYQHPSIALALVARHVPKGAAPLLDAGAGTGLVGQWLRIMGYPHVEALDISEGMLAVARAKNCYSAFHLLGLGGPLPFSDGQFAGIVSSGVFTSGHVGVEGLDELIRSCAGGGVIVLTVKGAVWDAGFETHLRNNKRVRIVEVTEPYISMPGEAATTPSLGVVLRVVE